MRRYLSLVANIVNTLIARAAYRAEVEATQQLIATCKPSRCASRRFEAGTAPCSNVISLETQLATYRASIPGLEQKPARCEDLLAALTGHVPAQWRPTREPRGSRSADLALPKDLPVSLPSALVRQRPDILAAEGTAHAASANVGVATAAMPPSVTLSGSYAANGTSTAHLLAASGRAPFGAPPPT
jgi:outer membrane protein TolC